MDDDLGANSLTLAEVLVVPVRDGRLDSTLAALRDFEIQELPFPDDAAAQLAQLRATAGLRMPGLQRPARSRGCRGQRTSFDVRLTDVGGRETQPTRLARRGGSGRGLRLVSAQGSACRRITQCHFAIRRRRVKPNSSKRLSGPVWKYAPR